MGARLWSIFLGFLIYSHRAKISWYVGATRHLNEATLRNQEACEFIENQPLEYGVDVSFPMHHLPSGHSAINCTDSKHNRVCKATSLDAFAQDRSDFYNNRFMKGCSQAFGKEACLRSEQERVEMSHRQPATMKNMTNGLGFQKLRLPKQVFQRLLDFWDTNSKEAYDEEWPAGSTYINHWEAKPAVVRVDNVSVPGGGRDLEDHVWDALRPIVSAWTGQHLEQASMYGIRIYKTGNILATHVDRQPLVSSAIINVAQDLDEPWPLEVIGHDGRAHNVTMEPGDLVLYESHTILHGRPYPLIGRFMANLFVHFEPVLPNSTWNARPIYRLPMNFTKTCTPRMENGRMTCVFE